MAPSSARRQSLDRLAGVGAQKLATVIGLIALAALLLGVGLPAVLPPAPVPAVEIVVPTDDGSGGSDPVAPAPARIEDDDSDDDDGDDRDDDSSAEDDDDASDAYDSADDYDDDSPDDDDE